MAAWKIRQPLQSFFSQCMKLDNPFLSSSLNKICIQPVNRRIFVQITIVQFTVLLVPASVSERPSASSGLCVESPLHGLEQQLGVLLQQGQSLPTFTCDLLVYLDPVTPRGGLRQRVQLSLDCQEGLGQDAPHFLLIFTGLLSRL